MTNPKAYDAVCAVYNDMSQAGFDVVTLKGADRTLYWTVDRAVRGELSWILGEAIDMVLEEDPQDLRRLKLREDR